jgi:hypothetical protein
MGQESTPAAPGRTIESASVALGETVTEQVAGLGARLCLTATRVVILRDGAQLRPRSGIRSWPHGSVQVRLEPPRRGTGRLVLSDWPDGRSAVSLFVPADDWASAERVVGMIRSLASQVRIAQEPPSSPPVRRTRP